MNLTEKEINERVDESLKTIIAIILIRLDAKCEKEQQMITENVRKTWKNIFIDAAIDADNLAHDPTVKRVVFDQILKEYTEKIQQRYKRKSKRYYNLLKFIKFLDDECESDDE